VGEGLSFKLMFKRSGMNHYIGGWVAALELDEDKLPVIVKDQLSVISSMLVEPLHASWYKDLPLVEKQQFINLITPKKISKDVN